MRRHMVAMGSIEESDIDDTFTRRPIHFFNIKFWPPTNPLNATSSSSSSSHSKQHNSDLFDNHIDNFDLAKILKEKETLYCERPDCKGGLRVILCKTCMKGYCFTCAFRTHAYGRLRLHNLEVVEPRKAEVTVMHTTLLHHTSQGMSSCINALVNYDDL